MSGALREDAAGFARLHAGELDPGLTPDQRDLLGRIIAKRIERGAKLEAIARAVARGLPALGEQRAMRLGHDEAVRALGWERLLALREEGESRVAVSPAADACPACRAAGGVYPIDDAPPIPIAGCAHALGCRCMYVSPEAAGAPGDNAMKVAAGRSDEQAGDGQKRERPWYRPSPPRPHGPRWTQEQREAATYQRPQGQGHVQQDPGHAMDAQRKRTKREHTK